MRCEACQTAMGAGDRFCAACGAAAPLLTCSGCGQPSRPNASFCVHCGHPLAGVASAKMSADGIAKGSELKFVTVLRSDLVGSTNLVVGLQPEQALARLEPVLTMMQSAIERYNGVVSKDLGDGVQAVFGAPISDDNHAILACHAAVELVKRLQAMGDPALQVRVGLHSGYVVASAKSKGLSSIYTLDGPMLHLVERLQALATPDQILASGGVPRCSARDT